MGKGLFHDPYSASFLLGLLEALRRLEIQEQVPSPTGTVPDGQAQTPPQDTAQHLLS